MSEHEQQIKTHITIPKCETSMELEFTQLSYNVPIQKGKPQKCILQSVCGKFSPGNLTALIGPSGAGKSSLLNILSGVIKNNVTGTICINGTPATSKTLNMLSSYIAQDFALLPLLTIKEMFKYATDLKLGAEVDDNKKQMVADNIIKCLDLKNAENTLVKNLSGGEKKRLSIGIELITNPPLMFLDEPTSGLDTSTSIHIIQYLKNLASGNRTILCVIHQPSSKLFSMFDEIYVMAEGNIVYGGRRDGIVPTFSEAGYSFPEYHNPADHVIEIIKNKPDLQLKPHSNGIIAANDFTKQEFNYSLPSLQDSEKENDHLVNIKSTTGDDFPIISQTSGFWYQCSRLLKRGAVISSREINILITKILMCMFLGFLIGSLWYDIGNDADKVLSNLPLLLITQFGSTMMMVLVTVFNFQTEARAISQEIRNNWYSIEAYFLSKILLELPLLIISTSVVLFPMYILSSQPLETKRISLMWMDLFLTNFIGQSMGLSFGTLYRPEVAINLLVPKALILFSLTGFIIRLKDLPIFIRWIANFGFGKLSYELCIKIIYGYDRGSLDCYIPFCYMRSPKKILETFDITDMDITWNVIGLVLWILGYLFLFYKALKWKENDSFKSANK